MSPSPCRRIAIETPYYLGTICSAPGRKRIPSLVCCLWQLRTEGAEMPHTIRVLEEWLVEIVHTGHMTIKEATESRNEAGAVMTERDLRFVLADVSETDHAETTMDLYEFNASHYEVFPPGTRLAVVIPPDPGKAKSALFAETVALNRGIAMKIFLKCDEALQWLRQQRES